MNHPNTHAFLITHCINERSTASFFMGLLIMIMIALSAASGYQYMVDEPFSAFICAFGIMPLIFAVNVLNEDIKKYDKNIKELIQMEGNNA